MQHKDNHGGNELIGFGEHEDQGDFADDENSYIGDSEDRFCWSDGDDDSSAFPGQITSEEKEIYTDSKDNQVDSGITTGSSSSSEESQVSDAYSLKEGLKFVNWSDFQSQLHDEIGNIKEIYAKSSRAEFTKEVIKSI